MSVPFQETVPAFRAMFQNVKCIPAGSGLIENQLQAEPVAGKGKRRAGSECPNNELGMRNGNGEPRAATVWQREPVGGRCGVVGQCSRKWQGVPGGW